MRPILSRTICIQFMLIGAVLGLTMIGVLYSSDIFFKISSIILLIALLLETFPFCFLCDSLVEDSDDLSNILGQSHWIDAERKYKSTLRIFMHQVQQPIIFIGFGIILISVNSNIKVGMAMHLNISYIILILFTGCQVRIQRCHHSEEHESVRSV